jgi:hypothetical protein
MGKISHKGDGDGRAGNTSRHLTIGRTMEVRRDGFGHECPSGGFPARCTNRERAGASMKLLCKICGVTGADADFYRGVNSRCKECHKAKVRENRQEKADYYRTYDAYRYRADPKVKGRHKRYARTEAGKAAFAAARQRWLDANEHKRAAHVALGNAVRDGRVAKPEACARCGAGGRIEGHHHDYARPLDVEWLCRPCHVAEHRSQNNRLQALHEDALCFVAHPRLRGRHA